MRVFITGGTGFVGAHSTTALMKAGHEVVLLARNPSAVERYFGPRGDGVPDVVEGSMTDERAVARGLDDCDAVLHAAAMVGLDAAQAKRVYDTNTRGVERVVGGAHERGIENIVYVSSTAVIFDPSLHALDERAPVTRSPNPYGRSKVDSELYVRRLQERGAAVQVTYPTAIIGPDDPGLSAGNLSLPTFLDVVILLTTTGMQYVDVRDIALVHRMLLERGCPERPTEARYCVAGRYTEWEELAELLEEVSGARLRRLRVQPALVRAAGSLCDVVKHVVPFSFPLTRESAEYVTRWTPVDSTKVERELGMRHRAVEESLRDAITWLREAGHLKPRG